MSVTMKNMSVFFIVSCVQIVRYHHFTILGYKSTSACPWYIEHQRYSGLSDFGVWAFLVQEYGCC